MQTLFITKVFQIFGDGPEMEIDNWLNSIVAKFNYADISGYVATADSICITVEVLLNEKEIQ